MNDEEFWQELIELTPKLSSDALLDHMQWLAAKVKALLEAPDQFPMTDMERAEFEGALTHMNFIRGLMQMGFTEW